MCRTQGREAKVWPHFPHCREPKELKGSPTLPGCASRFSSRSPRPRTAAVRARAALRGATYTLRDRPTTTTTTAPSEPCTAGGGRPHRPDARGPAGDVPALRAPPAPSGGRGRESDIPATATAAFLGDAPQCGAEVPAGLPLTEPTAAAERPEAGTAEEAPRSSQCGHGSSERGGAERRGLRALGRSRE